MIDQYDIDRVKEAASIVDVVGEFYDLKRKGTVYQCLCPFHDDRHIGSFVVSPKKNNCWCFSCGKGGNAIDFIMQHEGLTFPDAVRWLAAKYSIDLKEEQPNPYKGKTRVCKPHQPLPELPTLELPLSMVQARANTQGNWLADYIRRLPWSEEQAARVEKMLRNYLVGTKKDDPSRTIFWQVDEQGKVRTGKIMAYGKDGHRDKVSAHNFDWAHSALERIGKIDGEKVQMRQCLFGLHLLGFAENEGHKVHTVNIVESEKTAIMCAIAYGGMPDVLWMATGGECNLRADKLKPLIDRGIHIYLYPDRQAEDKWQEYADIIAYKRLTIDRKMMYTYWQPRCEKEEKADFGDLIERLLTERPESRRACKTQTAAEIIDEWIKINPLLATLIERFDLHPIQ